MLERAQRGRSSGSCRTRLRRRMAHACPVRIRVGGRVASAALAHHRGQAVRVSDAPPGRQMSQPPAITLTGDRDQAVKTALAAVFVDQPLLCGHQPAGCPLPPGRRLEPPGTRRRPNRRVSGPHWRCPALCPARQACCSGARPFPLCGTSYSVEFPRQQRPRAFPVRQATRQLPDRLVGTNPCRSTSASP